MLRCGLFLTSLMVLNLSFAQSAKISLEDKSLSLQERYSLMKSNSQTFQDYKVIKEFILDGVWNIMMDSVKKQRLAIAQAKEVSTQLDTNLKYAELTLKNEREAAAEVLFASSHISIFGIDFRKNIFLTIVASLITGLAVMIGLMISFLKVMRANLKEKIVIADMIAHEYEDFKRRTLEKQTKLSRELQDERNKVEELKTRV